MDRHKFRVSELLSRIQGHRDMSDDKALRIIDEDVCKLWGKFPKPLARYTKSRDTLLNARPEGFEIQLSSLDGRFQFNFLNAYNTVASATAHDEKLAELAALIILKEKLKYAGN